MLLGQDDRSRDSIIATVGRQLTYMYKINSCTYGAPGL